MIWSPFIQGRGVQDRFDSGHKCGQLLIFEGMSFSIRFE